LGEEHWDHAKKADAEAQPFAVVHFFIEMQVGKEGGKEGGEAVDEAGFGSGEVLQAPKLECVGEVDAEERQEGNRKELDGAEFKAGAFKEG